MPREPPAALVPPPHEPNAPRQSVPLPELARVFLKLGTIAFGGPAAHIAMMEDEVVHRRRWLTREQFLDYLGATQLIPGPNSTELAIHVGHAKAGWPGLVVSGVCFIVPAALMVGALAWGYVRFGALPAMAGVLYGVKPVVVGVVAQALWRLGRTAVRDGRDAVLGVAAALAAVLGVHELLVIAGSGALLALARGVILRRRRGTARGPTNPVALVFAPLEPTLRLVGVSVAVVAAAPFSLPLLFGVFAKIGAVLFGSGYVLLAFLRADFVERLGWLTEQQLLDAVAVGQVTPGPVFTTATFVGFLMAGSTGALVATMGIFLPAFVFVAISGPLVPRLRRSALAAAVLDGVNVASLALMGVVTWQLLRAALPDWPALALAVASALLLVRTRLNAAWLVLSGAIMGVLLT